MTTSFLADKSDQETLNKIMESHVDVTGAKLVQIQISKDKKTLWVNVNGICLLRICRIHQLSEHRQ